MFQRIANLFKGFLGLFVSGLEEANPKALLEVEKENLRKQIALTDLKMKRAAEMSEMASGMIGSIGARAFRSRAARRMAR
jgi:phage shock protein A